MTDERGCMLLKGMKVLDLSSLLPGPFCSLMLASLGAEVIKVEAVGGGDPMRQMIGGLFAFLNRNKKSIALNLKSEKGKEIFFRLAKGCNVILEGFRPGVVKRLGVDYESVKKVNPEIIYCSVSGYGQAGPYADVPGHDLNYQGVAGLLSISGNIDSPPEAVSGIQVADICGTMFSLSSILAAYCCYLKEKKGTYIDVSMTDGLFAWMGPRICEWLAQGRPDKRTFMARGSYGAFRTRDGKYITLGTVETHFWENFCRLIGRSDLAVEKYTTWEGRNKHSEEIRPIMEKAIGEKDRGEWLKLCTENNIPVAPVNALSEVDADPHLVWRGLVEKNLPGGYFVQPFPVKFSEKEGVDLSPTPELGEHTQVLLRELGYGEEEMASMEREKVIQVGKGNS